MKKNNAQPRPMSLEEARKAQRDRYALHGFGIACLLVLVIGVLAWRSVA